MSQPTLGLVIVAAGQSSRMGAVDKVWADLGPYPVLLHSVLALGPRATQLVVVVRKDVMAQARRLLAIHAPGGAVVAGGHARQESVRRGIEQLDKVDVIAVHDAARPFAAATMIDDGVARLAECDGAVPAVPVIDTVKRIDMNDAVMETLDRATLRSIQTPQLFRGDVLRRVHCRDANGAVPATDDASLLEREGYRVTVFPGSPLNFKITTTRDLELAHYQIREAHT